VNTRVVSLNKPRELRGGELCLAVCRSGRDKSRSGGVIRLKIGASGGAGTTKVEQRENFWEWSGGGGGVGGGGGMGGRVVIR